MSHVVTKDNLFKPRSSKAEAKADLTTHTARAIMDAEAEGRHSKTAKLRHARLQMEANTATKALVKAAPLKSVAGRRALSSM
jgi:hypothetical protein